MRIGMDDAIWVVTEPTPQSELGDVCFEATFSKLLLQLRGGLDAEKIVALFTERNEAEIEAYGRLVAARAARAIAERGLKPGEAPSKIELIGPDGTVLFEAEIPPVSRPRRRSRP